MKYRYWVWLAIGGLPLLIYPFILLANIMSLAATPSPKPVPILLWLFSKAFLWGSTLYPAVYVFCGILAIAKSQQRHYHWASTVALLPLLYLVLVLAAMAGWMATGV
jgi:hypothetical protein